MQIADWSPSTTYSTGVVVKYNDDVWISSNPSQGQQPDKAPGSWKILFGNNDAVGAVQYLLKSAPLVIIADCDTTSATFGQLKNVCLERSNVMPSAGTYLQNQVVRNGNVTLAGGKTTAGWVRLTTGTGHVSGTDWTALVIPNS